jgi:hypothetical protein
LTAFAGLSLAPGFSAGETFESAVPNGEGDTRRSFSRSPVAFVSDESEDGTENVFDADCCNGIVAVVVVVAPFCGGGDNDGKEDVDGRVAAIGAGAFCVSAGADCVSNSGGGTWKCSSTGQKLSG